MGDSALLVTLGDRIDLAINRRVHALAKHLMSAGVQGLGECVPAYTTVLVHYDPLVWSYEKIARLVDTQSVLPGE